MAMLWQTSESSEAVVSVSYCKEYTHWANQGMIRRKGRATVTLGRDIWKFPAIMQAYCITKYTLVEGKTVIIRWKYREP